MVFHAAQPVSLFWRERGATLGVVAEDPRLEAAVYLVGERFQFAVEPKGEAYQRHQIGQLPLATYSFYLCCLHAGVGTPQPFAGKHQRGEGA